MKKKLIPTIDSKLYEKRKKEYEKDPEYRKAYAAEQFKYEVAEMLQEERAKHHFTQKVLAKRAGLKQQEVSRLEKGDANATLKTLFKIAQGMGKKVDIVFSDYEKKKKTGVDFDRVLKTIKAGK